MTALVVPSSMQISITVAGNRNANWMSSFNRQILKSKSRKTFKTRANFEDVKFSTAKVVTIRYSDLAETSADFSEELEAGFGPNGLGIIAISEVPKYSKLRENLLQLSHRLAALPDDAKRILKILIVGILLAGVMGKRNWSLVNQISSKDLFMQIQL